MAIALTKPVRRQMLSSTEQHGKNKGRAIIVALLPGDEIEFRIKGTRRRYSAYLGHCFRLAQILTMESEYKAKMQEYGRKKLNGQRAIKPRRPIMPFSKVYFEAIKR